MADALTQKDIDSLLVGATPNIDLPKPTTEVIAFDFRHPPRIARDRRANLETIFTRFALSIQAFLSSRLRMPTDVVLGSVEQATFAEFIFSLGSPCAATVFDLNPDRQHQGILDFGTDVSFFLVDRLFGGLGDAGTPKRPMTPLERTVLQGISERVLALFSDAWREDLAFETSYVGFESTPDALAITGRDENVLVANIEMRAGPFAGLLTVCLPLHALESFLQEKPQRTTRSQTTPAAERAAFRSAIERSISSAPLNIVAPFPLFHLRAADVATIEAGRVIHTGHHLEVPIEVLVSGKRRFLGSLGQIHRNLGLSIMETLGIEEDADVRDIKGKVL